jgi:predicted Zn-dependent peptidase
MNHARVSELPNGIRVLTIPMPHLLSASVGVFVHTGSRNETADNNGISHFLEHMAFKGTISRDAQAINLDAERMGVDVNAFTCREMTAYYMNGLGKHTAPMLSMLADIVCHSTFPEEEIERERAVIIQEAIEHKETPENSVAALLDDAMYGGYPMGRPVIGTSENIMAFSRSDLVAYVESQYTGSNIVIAAAGNIDPGAFERLAASLFGHLPQGKRHEIIDSPYVGGVRARKMNSFSQVFVNMAFPVANLADGNHAQDLAAIVFGGGASSPLFDQIRERMGLVYHVASACDVGDRHGSFIIDALTTPDNLDEFFKATGTLLRRHADRVDAVDLERAKNQLSVALVASTERASRSMQRAVDQLFTRNRLVDVFETIERVESITAKEVKAVFEGMLKHKPSVALVGKGATNSAAKAFAEAFQ